MKTLKDLKILIASKVIETSLFDYLFMEAIERKTSMMKAVDKLVPAQEHILKLWYTKPDESSDKHRRDVNNFIEQAQRQLFKSIIPMPKDWVTFGIASLSNVRLIALQLRKMNKKGYIWKSKEPEPQEVKEALDCLYTSLMLALIEGEDIDISEYL